MPGPVFGEHVTLITCNGVSNGLERESGMPFTVREIRDRVIPIAVCDYCGEEIQFTGDREDGWLTGNAEWAVEQKTRKRSSEVFLAHKQCTRQLEKEYLGADELWETMELPHYLAQLLQSMNFSLADLKAETQQHPVRDSD